MSDDPAVNRPATADSLAGQAVYSPSVLKIYDTLVLRISNPLIWRCPTRRLRAWYQTHLSGNHLDVGVGTGYFLDRARFPVPNPRIVLLDLNPHCLQTASHRIARYRPQTVQCDVLQPIDWDGERFDSIALNYVLHCLAGTIAEKSKAFDHLRPLLNPGGVIFGSTLLSHGVPRGWPARRLMAKYNATKVFSNADDALADLESELKARFSHVQIETAGCCAMFRGILT